MINVHIEAQEEMSAPEYHMAASILQILCQNSEFYENHQMFYNDQFRFTMTSQISETQKLVTDYNPVPRELFVAAVTKGQTTKIILTVDTEDGPEKIERQLLPVILVDMPHKNTAAVYIDHRPDFCPVFENDSIKYKFAGEMDALIKKHVTPIDESLVENEDGDL